MTWIGKMDMNETKVTLDLEPIMLLLWHVWTVAELLSEYYVNMQGFCRFYREISDMLDLNRMSGLVGRFEGPLEDENVENLELEMGRRYKGEIWITFRQS